MDTQPPSMLDLPAGHSSPIRASDPLPIVSRTLLRTFLTAIMSLLTILVFGLALECRDALWLWIAFICALVSGFFVQLLIAGNQ